MTVRTALAGDLEAVLQLADRRRRHYAEYQPQFWRPAPDAMDRQREFFTSLLQPSAARLFAVAVEADRVRGFVIATLGAAPPVYDPGGPTCLIDDFAVDDDASWPEIGSALLAFARSWAGRGGGAQVVVVTAGRDEPKRALLQAAGLSLASEWWVGPLWRPCSPGPNAAESEDCQTPRAECSATVREDEMDGRQDGRQALHVDCSTCVVRNVACGDCVVSVLLGVPAEGVDIDGSEQAALRALADSGLVPPLRLIPGARRVESVQARSDQTPLEWPESG